MSGAPSFRRLALIGIGLIGASMALAMRRAGAAKVIVCCDSNPKARKTALDLGIVKEGADFESMMAFNTTATAALARRITVTREPSVPDGDEPYVDVEVKDGTVLTARVPVARGDCTNPLSEDELRDKFRSLAGRVLTPAEIIRSATTVGARW